MDMRAGQASQARLFQLVRTKVHGVCNYQSWSGVSDAHTSVRDINSPMIFFIERQLDTWHVLFGATRATSLHAGTAPGTFNEPDLFEEKAIYLPAVLSAPKLVHFAIIRRRMSVGNRARGTGRECSYSAQTLVIDTLVLDVQWKESR